MTQLSELTCEQIERLSRSALEEAAAIEIAIREIRPITGEFFPDPDDDAVSVYRKALEMAGVKLEGIDPSEFRAMVRLLAETGGAGGKLAGDRAIRHEPNPAMAVLARVRNV